MAFADGIRNVLDEDAPDEGPLVVVTPPRAAGRGRPQAAGETSR
ncbi:MAG: hypothetical protein ACRDJH_14820 [Thermomicrobiales bacterium]